LNPSRLGRPAGTRASPLARATCAIYALLLLYAGLAPWAGWRDVGVSAFAYLAAPLPRYITGFDLVVNVAAYAPLGALAMLALHPRLRGAAAVAAATLAGLLLSGFVEAVQTFLPTRVSSNVDLVTNTAGTLVGALAVMPFSAALIDRGRLVAWRHRWYEADATGVLLALLLWPAAQIYPEPMLFGNGNLRGALEPVLTALGGHWWEFAPERFGPAEFVLAEAFVVAAAVLAAGLALGSVAKRNAPRYLLIAGTVATALAAKSLANAVQFGPVRLLAWFTPGAFGGLALGALSLAAAIAGPRVWQRRLAWVALAALLVTVNIVPDNPYHLAQLQVWRQGRLLNFNELANWISTLWPLALAVALASRPARD
jgi:VanZ family protein